MPVCVDGVPLLAFRMESGHLLLTLQLFDEFNRPILVIRDNELVYKPDAWDIQLTGRNLVVREAARRFLLDIVFDVPNGVHVKRGRFLLNGVELLIGSHGCFLNDGHLELSMSRVTVVGGSKAAGFLIGQPAPNVPHMIRLPTISRYRHSRAGFEDWAREAFSDVPDGAA